jgi:hypothetical protein
MPRLSFTLRDVFWLTLVVGMGVGWCVDRSHLVSLLEFAIRKIEYFNSLEH